MRRVCENVAKGEYLEKPIDLTEQSRQKGIVDHYHQIVYCDIGKVGTTSWHQFFMKLTKKERAERSSWRADHPYSWYDMRPSDRWK